VYWKFKITFLKAVGGNSSTAFYIELDVSSHKLKS